VKREIVAKDQSRPVGVGGIALQGAAKAERFVEAVGDVLVGPAPEDDGVGAARAGCEETALGEGAPDSATAREGPDREARELRLTLLRDLPPRSGRVEDDRSHHVFALHRNE
jgi:predicted NodU family carbamoyl transferase